MKKRKKKNRAKKKANAFQHILRTSNNNSYTIIDRTINSLSINEIKTLNQQIIKNKIFSKFLLPNTKYFKYFYQKEFKLSIDKLLAWIEIIIINSCNQLNEFITMESDVAKNILSNDYSKALNLLNIIESKFGESMWGIQTSAYIISKLDSIENAVEYLESKNTQSSLFNYFLYQLSLRIAGTHISYDRNLELNQLFEESEFDSEMFRPFLKYKTLPYNFTIDVSSEAILNYELDSSIIDLYKGLIFCLSNELSSDSSSKELWINKINCISDYIDDPILLSLTNMFGNFHSSKSIVTKETNSFVNNYTIGNYSNVVKIFNKSKTLSTSFNACEIVIKSAIKSQKIDINSIKNISIERIADMNNILLINKDFTKSMDSIYLDSFCLNSLSWFVNQHINLLLNTIDLNDVDFSMLNKAYSIRLDMVSEFKTKSIDLEQNNYIFEFLKTKYPESDTLILHELYTNKNKNLQREISILNIDKDRKNSNYLACLKRFP